MSNIPTELDSLKERAKTMGLKHHPSIGVEKLKIMINTVLDAGRETEVVTTTSTKETKSQRIQRLRKVAHKLVRVVISSRNPEKTEWDCESFTASNSVIGSITKVVPYNNEEGWHVPQIIVNMIKERKCNVFTWKDTKRGGRVKVGKQISEFVVTILPDLTPVELKELAERQAVARTIDD